MLELLDNKQEIEELKGEFNDCFENKKDSFFEIEADSHNEGIQI